MTIKDRQTILRLLAKEVLVDRDTLTIRHLIPLPDLGPGSGGGCQPGHEPPEGTAELTDWVESKWEGKFGLAINREKTRGGEGKPEGGSLDFLGYTFRWDRDLRGHR